MTNAIEGTDLPSEALQSPTLELSDILRHYARCSLAENTWRTYRSQWQRFAIWCRAHGTVALPANPEVVAQYLAERAHSGTAVASLEVALAALRFAHLAAGRAFCVDSPTLRLVMNGIRRQHLRPQRQVEPLTGKLLRKLLSPFR